jgi:hypothetical protein
LNAPFTGSEAEKLKYHALNNRSCLTECGVDVPPISNRPRRISVKKTLLYRLVVDPVALLVTYFSTGQIVGSIAAVIIIEAFSTVFYYVLDRTM